MKSCEDTDDLLQLAFEIPLKSDELLTSIKLIRDATLPPLESLSVILTQDQLAILWTFVPPRYRIQQLKLLYCSSKHGFNLNQLNISITTLLNL